MIMRRARSFAALIVVVGALTGCGGGSGDAEGKPLVAEACGFVLDAGKIVISNDPPSADADVVERAVDKAVKVAHRAAEANPDYKGVLRGATMAKDAVESGDSQQLAAAIKTTTKECALALGGSLPS